MSCYACGSGRTGTGPTEFQNWALSDDRWMPRVIVAHGSSSSRHLPSLLVSWWQDEGWKCGRAERSHGVADFWDPVHWHNRQLCNVQLREESIQTENEDYLLVNIKSHLTIIRNHSLKPTINMSTGQYVFNYSWHLFKSSICWTCDLKFTGSTPDHPFIRNNSQKVVHSPVAV